MDDAPVPSSSSRKRSFDDEHSSIKPPSKRVRFPKGKKVKAETPVLEPVKEDVEMSDTPDLSDPRTAAKERARRRSQLTTQLFTEDVGEVALSRISAAEVRYQENETFVNDGIPMEPFNLEKEREEGYFDEAGNFVEYVAEKEEKDAWLDSVEVDPKLAERLSSIPTNVDEEKETSPDDIGKMKRQIADALEPGETILQALKRLKGHSSDKKAKMSAETKHVFDQLTEDAMKLMENGDYNVYHEEREVFQREAEGYEALARARNGEEEFDMFADEANDVVAKSEHNIGTSVPGEGTSNQSAGDMEVHDSGDSWVGQSDYVYDEASGYYYSNSLGYYYDPSTGLFCSASSGQWYKYNDDTSSYDEVQTEPDVASNDG
ncbi:hypothetical protein RND81_11G155800 [Saponaria officinalis]|uniref:OCRE domain-containing protein n=1 Tax=Saponaria officinalis TaxID=3572 RepID=A0AAW1HP53_SAPOF